MSLWLSGRSTCTLTGKFIIILGCTRTRLFGYTGTADRPGIPRFVDLFFFAYDSSFTAALVGLATVLCGVQGQGVIWQSLSLGTKLSTCSPNETLRATPTYLPRIIMGSYNRTLLPSESLVPRLVQLAYTA